MSIRPPLPASGAREKLRSRFSLNSSCSRVRTELIHQVIAARQDCRQEDVCTFVVSGCDAAEVLETAEHLLDDVAAFVSGFIVAMRMLPGRIWRDHGLDAACGQFVAQAPGVVGSIGQQTTRVANHADQTACTDQVMGVARSNQEGKRTADIVCQCVDFGGLPAARAADCIVEGPPFAPAAERWALT